MILRGQQKPTSGPERGTVSKNGPAGGAVNCVRVDAPAANLFLYSFVWPPKFSRRIELKVIRICLESIKIYMAQSRNPEIINNIYWRAVGSNTEPWARILSASDWKNKNVRCDTDPISFQVAHSATTCFPFGPQYLFYAPNTYFMPTWVACGPVYVFTKRSYTGLMAHPQVTGVQMNLFLAISTVILRNSMSFFKTILR